MFKKFQQLGKAFMLPIAILPAAGLLLGIGGALSNPNTVKTYELLNNTVLQGIFKIMAGAGATVFSNIALIFAIGISLGLAKKDKATAALSGAVSFLVFNATISSMISVFSTEKIAIDTGIVGALAIGFTVSYLQDKYGDVRLPQFLGFLVDQDLYQ